MNMVKIPVFFFLVICTGMLVTTGSASSGCLCPATEPSPIEGCPIPLCPFLPEPSGPCLPCLCPFGDGTCDGTLPDESLSSSLAADFVASPSSGPAPLEVTFHDQSSGTPNAWLWDFGDGETSDAENPVHIYQQPGSYRVRLTVSREDKSPGMNYGRSSSTTKEISVGISGGTQDAPETNPGAAPLSWNQALESQPNFPGLSALLSSERYQFHEPHFTGITPGMGMNFFDRQQFQTNLAVHYGSSLTPAIQQIIPEYRQEASSSSLLAQRFGGNSIGLSEAIGHFQAAAS